MKNAVIIAAVAIGLFRPVLLFVEFNQHVEASYEAFAHLLVGALIGAWWVTRRRWMLVAFALLTVVEVVCAAIGIAMKLQGG